MQEISIPEYDKSIQLAQITDRHDAVSKLATPKLYVKKKMDMDYVEIGYMKKQADKYYPGWSWEIVSTEVLGTAAYVVHGRLMWYDGGHKRIGDMTAAHRIQTKRGTTEFVDIGNDIKAANTDCMKKAFNMYMNIADDVYRNQVEDTELSIKQVEDILTHAEEVSEDMLETIKKQIDDGKIHAINYKRAIKSLIEKKKEVK